MEFPSLKNDFLATHAEMLLSSYRYWTDKDLLAEPLGRTEAARSLFEAPFIVLSHDTQRDPVLNYANSRGLVLFELGWEELTRMPSRLTADLENRSERASLMRRVTEHGFIDDYSGVRVSSTGRRFLIERATVWNLVDARGAYRGQAAAFSDWTPLSE